MNEYKLFDTRGNIFKTEESGIQVKHKPNIAIKENGSKIVPVLTSEGKSGNITVIACYNAPGLFF